MSGTALVKVDDIQSIQAWGKFAKDSGVIPPNCNQHQAAAIVQTGRELGLQPMQSLRSMCFVNGRLTMSVQLQLAFAKAKGVKVAELTESEDYCKVTLERNGEKITCEYGKADAEKAQLLSKDNWKKYGKQMYRWRAVGDALRLIAPDLVMGLLDPIEAENIEAPEIVIESVYTAPTPQGAASPEAGVPGTASASLPFQGEPDEHGMRDELAVICESLSIAKGVDVTEVVMSLTQNKDGKFGKKYINDIPFKLLKKDKVTEWSPLEAILSKARKELEGLQGRQPGDEDGL